MGEQAQNGARIEAWVARRRVKEMQAKGWRALGPIRDDAVWMEGPDPDAGDDGGLWGGPCGGAWAEIGASLPSAAVAAARRLRADHAAALALRQPHGRRVA